ncbi:MAG: GatB/YqeY domain-containing protein [Schleiferiaceae bacterium]|nr:GatB/YqeY domain-containing protein [Schleiferiaceae bacterium]
MNLEAQIQDRMKTAMRAKDKKSLEALRAVKSAILLAKTEKAGSDELSEDTEIKLLQKLVKQRKEAAAIFHEQNRPELAEDEEFQAGIIEAFLPAQLSDAELTDYISDLIEKLGATSIKDMGKVIGTASKELAGKAEGRAISEKVKALLNA